MTDEETAIEMGHRLRALRLAANVSVADLAARTGLNRNTVVNAEAGNNPRLLTIIRVLRALGRLDAFDAFLPVPAISPLALLETGGKARQRARKRKGPRG